MRMEERPSEAMSARTLSAPTVAGRQYGRGIVAVVDHGIQHGFRLCSSRFPEGGRAAEHAYIVVNGQRVVFGQQARLDIA